MMGSSFQRLWIVNVGLKFFFFKTQIFTSEKERRKGKLKIRKVLFKKNNDKLLILINFISGFTEKNGILINSFGNSPFCGGFLYFNLTINHILLSQKDYLQLVYRFIGRVINYTNSYFTFRCETVQVG